MDPRSSVRPLLFKIARNVALNARRTTKRRAVRALAAVGLRVERVEAPDERLEASELQQAVTHAINSLPPRRRETFWLSRYEGLSYREIGEIMSISPQTVANHLSIATAELRVLLRPLIE
jgi:RNA polymerase sigma-70 factor, ECF subfamily